MNERFKELYRRTSEYHKSLISELDALSSEIMKAEDLEAIANIRFVTWHLERLGADIKKKLARLDQIAITATAFRWLNSSVTGEPIRTEYATFSPSLAEVPKLPSRDDEPERYIECLKAMGVSEEAAKTGMVRMHWPALKEYREQLDLEGKPLPAAFGDGEGVMSYACRVSHKKREVLE